MIILSDVNHQASTGYLNTGPVACAKSLGSEVLYIDFNNVPACFDAVKIFSDKVKPEDAFEDEIAGVNVSDPLFSYLTVLAVIQPGRIQDIEMYAPDVLPSGVSEPLLASGALRDAHTFAKETATSCRSGEAHTS